jgi:tRNA modification GTPase
MQSIEDDDTITAIATPPGVGGVGIIRISGGLVKNIAKVMLGRSSLIPKLAVYTEFLSANKEAIDNGIAIFFQAPNSFTGEDVLEIQAHGGVVVLDLLLRRVLSLGARLAEPGEFSRRSFLHGKMDLLQAESIISLIHAQTEQAAKAAVKSLQGEFSKQINALLQGVTNLRMYVEAAIDFPEEEVDFLEDNNIYKQLIKFKESIYKILNQAQQGNLLSNGLKAVILGGVNVGKSSLLNLLSGKDLAIVTNIPGTTRDVLINKINIDGLLVDFSDTAGIRETQDHIEAIGIQKAITEAREADLILFVLDAKDFVEQEDFKSNLISAAWCADLRAKKIILINKIDLYNDAFLKTPEIIVKDEQIVIFISVKNQIGIDLLKQQIKKVAGFVEQEQVFTARTRHVTALQQVYVHVERSINFFKKKREGVFFELLAEELKLAQKFLSEITGAFTSEDLLAKIFSEFCIGK